MKRMISAMVVAVFMLVAGAVLAFAHTPRISDTCENLSVNLTQYNDKKNNSVTVWVDGKQVDHVVDFGKSFSNTYQFDNKYVNHTYRVRVHAWDDPNFKNGWSFDKSGTSKACDRPSQPTDKPHAQDQKTCEAGVEHRDGTEAYVWNGSQWVLSGEIKWSEWKHVRDLTNDEKKELDCAKPQAPQPKVETTTEESKNCDTSVVTVTTTTKTYNPVFDYKNWEWVYGEPEVKVETSTRPATNEECPKSTPTPSDTPTQTPTPTPSDTPSETPTPTPSDTPSNSPSPSQSPSVTPTAHSTVSPSPSVTPENDRRMLAQTGNDWMLPAALIAVLLILAGAGTVKAARSKRSH